MGPRSGHETWFVCIAAAGLAVGCTSTGTEESSTPRITVDANTDLDSSLLTPDDFRSVPGLQDGTVTDLEEVPAFENPDPRGPCGGVVPAPDFSGATGRAFIGPNVTVVTLVLETGDAQQAYRRALQGDVTDACDTFRSTTNTGDTQTVSDISILDFDAEGVEAIGWTSRVQLGPQSGFAGVWLIETEARTAFVQYQGLEPIVPDAMTALAERTFERLSD